MEISQILAPWEYDSNAPPQIVSATETELSWQGEKRAAIVAVLDSPELARGARPSHFLVARLKNDSAAWWWCSSGYLRRLHEPKYRGPNRNAIFQKFFPAPKNATFAVFSGSNALTTTNCTVSSIFNLEKCI